MSARKRAADASGVHKKVRRTQKFITDYSDTWPHLVPSKRGDEFAFCKQCHSDFSVGHGGRDDCRRHIDSKKHQEYTHLSTTTKNISTFFKASVPESNELGPTRAETLFTHFLVEHNLPMSAADHATKLFPKMFPDSKIAGKYSSGRTKTTAIVNELGKESMLELATVMKTQPFSIATDGSSEGEDKFFPIVVRHVDHETGIVRSELLSNPISNESATGENIFNVLDSSLNEHEVKWDNCVAFGSDNASVMTGSKKGVISFITQKCPEIYFVGCPCHLIHLAAEYGARQLPVHVDELLTDIYYYLDKSTKRQSALKQMQVFCGTEQRKILKHVSTRWLSLEQCINRLLQQWRPLREYFENECKSGASTSKAKPANPSKTASSPSTSKPAKPSKPATSPSTAKPAKPSKSTSSTNTSKALHVSSTNKHTSTSSVSETISKESASIISSVSGTSKFSDNETSKSIPSTGISDRKHRVKSSLQSAQFKVYTLFLQHIIPVFNAVNVLLQSDKPLIYRLRRVLLNLLKQLLLKFVRPSAMVFSDVRQVDYTTKYNHKDDKDLVIGSETREYITNTKGLDEKKTKLFYDNVKNYLITACDYIKKKFPLNDTLLKHAEIVDISLRQQSNFNSVKYFINRFPAMLPKGACENDIEEEFCNFQVDELNDNICALERADSQWFEISKLVDECGSQKYKVLPKVMSNILVIPQSNAECERVFSIVRKNKTDFRGSMNHQTLEKLLVLKINSTTTCFNQSLSEATLKRAKSATYQALNN